MNEWELAALVLAAAIVPCLGRLRVRRRRRTRWPRSRLRARCATTTLIVLSEGFHRQPFIDLAVVLAVAVRGRSLAFARLMERDL